MKKLLKLSFYFAMAGLMFAACSKDDEEEELLKPQIAVLTPTGGEATVTPGSTAAVSITMSSNDKLEKISATTSLNGSSTGILDLSSDPNETDSILENGTTSFNFDGFIDIPLGTAGSTYVVVFTVTDKDDRTNSAAVTFTIENDAPTVATYTVVVVGNQNSSAGSYYDAITNNVNTSAQANANQASIDFMYYDGVTNKHTLASMDETGAGTFGTVGTWSTRNATRFSGDLGLSSADFDAVSSSSEVQTYAANNTASLANQLAVGKVVSFKTSANHGGKSGLVRVSEINTTA
ncbi:MAG: hypothetical protein ACJAY8_001061, partial [Sphingobacteriales bacterium]